MWWFSVIYTETREEKLWRGEALDGSGEVGKVSDHQARCTNHRARMANPFWIQSHGMAGLGVHECAK